MGFRGGVVAALALLSSGCVTIGPMPGLTFATATPDRRAQVEVGAALVPGYFVSDAVLPIANDRTAYGVTQLQVSGFVDPGDALGGLGLSVGGRAVGGGAGYIEPMLRYRRAFGDDGRFGLGITAGGSFASYQDPDHPPLAVSLAKGSLEAAGDVRLTPRSWIELHGLGGAALTVLSANGKWCANPSTGAAGQCPTEPRTTPILIGTAQATGAFPSGYLGIAADLGRSWSGSFHLLRIAAVVAGGNLPQVKPLEPTNVTSDTTVTAAAAPRAWWSSWGLALTLAMGQPGPRPAAVEPGRLAPLAPPAPTGPGRIVGRVVDEGQRGVAGVTVRLPSGASSTTGADGTFTIDAVEPGVIPLELSAAGYQVAKEAVSVPAGGAAELSVVLARASQPALAEVRGEIRSGGKAIAGARIRLEGNDARTGADGRFELRVPKGRYTLNISAPGFVEQTRTIDVEVGQQALFYVELSAATDR